MNKIFLLGRLTKDPELKQTPNNVSVTAFSVAVSRPYTKGKDKEVDFIDCVAWRGTAEFVCSYFSKGKPILVEGKLQVRSYEDKQGNKRRVFEVVCDNVSFVEGAAKNEAQGCTEGATEEFQEVEHYDDLPF